MIFSTIAVRFLTKRVTLGTRPAIPYELEPP